MPKLIRVILTMTDYSDTDCGRTNTILGEEFTEIYRYTDDKGFELYDTSFTRIGLRGCKMRGF